MVGRPRAVDRVRRAAARLLARWQRDQRHIEELVELQDKRQERDEGGPWSYAERRRLRELVYSCVRLRGRYDHVIATRSRKSRRDSGR